MKINEMRQNPVHFPHRIVPEIIQKIITIRIETMYFSKYLKEKLVFTQK